MYYEKKIDQLKSNVKGTWKVLNEILNRDRGERGLPSIFRTDSQEISDPIEIANQFCKYFTNIGPSLASKIPVSEKSHNSFLSPKLVNSLFLETANELEIVEICNNCRSGTAVGNDNISMNLIKETVNLVISPLQV